MMSSRTPIKSAMKHNVGIACLGAVILRSRELKRAGRARVTSAGGSGAIGTGSGESRGKNGLPGALLFIRPIIRSNGSAAENPLMSESRKSELKCVGACRS